MGYDYVVVGTGAAGSVLADRLSASGKYSVLVLEAGGSDRNPMHRVPKGWVFTMQNEDYVKMYTPEPFGDDTVEAWPRGIIKGGSTTLNGLGWNTGEPSAYNWEEQGNAGWNWQAFRNALDKIENRKKGLAAFNPKHGRMSIEMVTTQDEFGDAMLSAFATRGAKVVPDLNLTSGPRASYTATNTRKGFRWSAASAFLRPALRRKNVTLITHAEVTRVLFSGRTAVGVEAQVNGRLERFAADKEVLLAAGSLESPMLLERSGIGAPDVLRDAGVELIAESPKVGENLSEHRGFTILYHLNDRMGYNHELNTPLRQLITGAKFLLTRRGIISSGSFDVHANLQLEADAKGVDTQIFAAGLSYGEGMVPEKRAGGLISGYAINPTSRGSIHITGPRPADAPRIVTGYYQTDYDKRMIVKVVREMRAILDTPALKSLGAEEYYPGPAVSTDEEIVHHSLNSGPYGYHTLGTAAIGPDEDDVVDERLRVRGVNALRVVDASIFPYQPSGNNSGPTSAAAWIAADLILEDAEKNKRRKATINAMGT